MRISEKTHELTLCSQLSFLISGWATMHGQGFVNHSQGQPIWFGLTQKEEAKAGFDAATRLRNGRLFILQFKAGWTLQSGIIRFEAKHKQFEKLHVLSDMFPGQVFYVFPGLTDSRQLCGPGHSLLAETWFLDIDIMPLLGAPTRKSEAHNVYLDSVSGEVVFRSNPVHVQATKALESAPIFQPGISTSISDCGFEEFWGKVKFLGSGTVGLLSGDSDA